MKRIIYLAAVLMLGACGNSNHSSQGPEADSASLSSQETIHKRKHNADNFYAFHYKDDGIYVGNNVEMLQKLELANGFAPVLAADGNILAYTEPDSLASKIHLYNIATGEDVKLNFGPFHCQSGAFGANGRMLAYSLCNIRNIWNVCLFDSKNRTNEVLSADRDPDGDYRPTFSPDGEFLLFHNMRRVKIFSVKDGNTKFYKYIDCENFCQRNALAISPSSKFQMTADHKNIVFSCEDYSAGMRSFQRLFVYNIATQQVRDILKDEFSCGDFQISDDGNIYYIQVFPDGSRYLYMASVDDLKTARVSSKPLGNSPMLSLAY